MNKYCFFCGGQLNPHSDPYCVSVNLAKQIWFEGKLLEGSVEGLHVMCETCQREIREFLLELKKSYTYV